MKKLIALGIFLSLAVSGCETNQTQPSSSKDESPRVLPSAKPVGPGKATFQKKGGELETFDITIHDRGHKNFYGEGSAPVIIIDWSDGYSSAYLFRPDNGGLVYDYDPKTKKWKYSGSEMRWAYKGENVSITSENGAKTVLGGAKKKLEPMIGTFINVRKKQAAVNAVRETGGGTVGCSSRGPALPSGGSHSPAGSAASTHQEGRGDIPLPRPARVPSSKPRGAGRKKLKRGNACLCWSAEPAALPSNVLVIKNAN